MTAKITLKVLEQANPAALHTLLQQIGKNVQTETAVFQQTSDMLAYHNRLPDLIHLLQTARATLQTSSQSSEWQQQSVVALLTDSLIFQHLSSLPAEASAKAPDSLRQSLQAFTPIDAEGLDRYLAHLCGYTQYQWQLAHLADHPPQNMAALMIEFSAYARREAGVPHSRSNLLRHLLPSYFVERRTGQLTPRQDIGDLMRRGRPIPRPPSDFHPLAPDSDTMQRFLGKLLNYDPVRPYAAAALFILLPVWLAFLQARHLLTASEGKATLDELASLRPDLLAYFEEFEGDEGLVTAVSQWPQPLT